MDKFEKARHIYKPRCIKYLLIAESPPEPDSNRFFYFKKVKKGDSLFLATMRALHKKYRDCPAGLFRNRKREFLENFKENGFYLIDASKESIAGMSPSKKKKCLENSLCSLKENIKNLISENLVSEKTKIILISTTVYDVCYNELKRKLEEERLNIINKRIPFPLGKYRSEFMKKLSYLVDKRLIFCPTLSRKGEEKPN